MVVATIDDVYGPGVRNLHCAFNAAFNRMFMSTHHVMKAGHQLVVNQSPHEYMEYAYLIDLVEHLKYGSISVGI